MRDWIPKPAQYRNPDAPRNEYPEAPYTSSHAIKAYRCYGGVMSWDPCHAVKVQYAIELEKRLQEAAKYIAELEALLPGNPS